MQQDQTSTSTWRMIQRELKAAPPKARQAMLISVVMLDVGILVGIWDLVTGPRNPQEMQRLFSLFSAITGVAVLVVAQVLHQVSQGLECGAFQMPSVKQNRFHRAQLALPLLSAIALVLFALAIGILGSMVADRPVLILFGVFISFYVVYAIRMIHHTTGFLYRHATEQAEAAARAQAQATEAQLTALRAQMNPHFLFNALNTVASLVRTNHRAAEATVEHLADVLRRTLDRSQSNHGTVQEEIEYLHAYLAVEQERFGARLAVNWKVDDAALPLELPPLTLQPLVENALKHGIGSKLEGGALSIEVARQNGHLSLTVADNGVGFPARHREGTGMGNLRQRLATLYGSHQDLSIATSPAGTRVSVLLPARLRSGAETRS